MPFIVPRDYKDSLNTQEPHVTSGRQRNPLVSGASGLFLFDRSCDRAFEYDWLTLALFALTSAASLDV